MVYIYKDDKGRYIISQTQIEDLPISLVFNWSSLPLENIRPWKILGISSDLYKPGIIKYLSNLKNQPKKENLVFVYKKEIDSIFSDYKKILDLLYSLELIKESPELKYKKFIIYECDIKNYMEDLLGDSIMELIEKYKNLGEQKKNILIHLSNLSGRENKLDYIKGLDIDLELFTFLPPWLKSSYQVFGIADRIVRNPNIINTEYSSQDNIDGYIGESIIKENIYNVFYNGEVLSAKEIKGRLTALYQHLGLQRTAKVSDLENYFEIMRTYSRLYRLDRKKII